MPGDAAASRGGRSAYEVLGVPRGASAAELRRAFEQLAKAAHPDTSARGAASAARFQEVKEAYDLLRHAERRRAYDARSGARHQHGRYGAYDAAADRAMQERAEEFRKRYQRGFHAPDDDGLAGARSCEARQLVLPSRSQRARARPPRPPPPFFILSPRHAPTQVPARRGAFPFA